MSETLNNQITQLKQLLGKFTAADEDFYESEEVAEYDPDKMFQYFRNELDDAGSQQILRLANESKLFLEDLIGIGEMVLAEKSKAEVARSVAWQDLCSLASLDPSKRQNILAKRTTVQFDIAPVAALAAASGGVDVEATLPFGAKVTAYEDDDLVMKITSDDQALHGQLVGYCLSDETSDQLGYVILRKGILDKVSGIVRIDRSKLSGSYRTSFENVDYSDLSNADFQLLEAAIDQDKEDSRSLAAWENWIELGADSPDGVGLSKLLSNLKQSLAVK